MEFLQTISLKESVAAFMVLFAIIDIFGSVPIILDIKAKTGEVGAAKASLVAFAIFLIFFFAGEPLLGLFGVDISSFAIAGSIVILLLGLEMVLGIELFKNDSPAGGTVVPIAFPLIALIVNMIVVFTVLKMTSLVERILGPAGVHILRKIFGIILLAIAVKLFITNTGIILPS